MAKKPPPSSSKSKTVKPVKSQKIEKPAKPQAQAAKTPPPVQAEVPEKNLETKSAAKAVILPAKYDPEKDKGKFMNPFMMEFFRQLLVGWRTELVRESQETIHNTLQGTELQKPDLADRAAAETDHALELRTRDRERKLISKINQALERIDAGEYGFCEETGEPISVARLKARPIATLSLEAQERHERLERTQRDD